MINNKRVDTCYIYLRSKVSIQITENADGKTEIVYYNSLKQNDGSRNSDSRGTLPSHTFNPISS